MSAAERWARALAAWAIPDEIMAAAPESPWGHSHSDFAAAATDAMQAPLTPSHRRAVERLPDGGVVLDVGAGGGATSLPLAPPAGTIVAVDENPRMLDELRRLARGRVGVETITGRWPDVAPEVGPADVVVCGHVAYNVADLDRFVVALTEHARHRVVLELTATHPQSALSPLWAHFWQLERPTTPAAADAAAVIEESVGVSVSSEEWERSGSGRSLADAVVAARRRLCLSPEADEELAALLGPSPRLAPVAVVTLWWAGGAA